MGEMHSRTTGQGLNHAELTLYRVKREVGREEFRKGTAVVLLHLGQWGGTKRAESLFELPDDISGNFCDTRTGRLEGEDEAENHALLQLGSIRSVHHPRSSSASFPSCSEALRLLMFH